jgi:hypothetical protein
VKQQTQGNPLAAGLVALGVGALAGSLIPTSRTEKQAARQLADQAEGIVEPVKETVSESARSVMEEAKTTAREGGQQVADAAKEGARTAGQEVREQARATAEQARESHQEG